MKLLVLLGLLAVLSSSVFDDRKPLEQNSPSYVLVIEDTEKEEQARPTGHTITLETADGIRDLDLEEYLVGVVLTEMPASFELEAMKAQAVAARTFALRMAQSGKHTGFDLCAEPGCCQAWRGEDELRAALGENFDAALEKGAAAVQETEGQVLLYEGELIEALYYSCSGGMSEPAVAVWGTDVPYLQAVESPGEGDCTQYSSEVKVSFSRFAEVLKQADPLVQLSVIPHDWVGEITRSDGGGILTMELGGVRFTGPELRKLFSLASTKFDLTVCNGEMVFAVYGYGHRVGMSQYGADAMAAEGAGYEQILTHYYTGVSIKKLSRT